MKQKLLLFIALFSFFVSKAQINPPRSEHHVVPCEEALIDSSCNFISNPIFRTTGDSVEDFSDGEIFMWQDVNKFTTDINAALSAGMGWSSPTVPTNLAGANYASMLVDNRFLETEGIAGKTFLIEKDKKYALSFFLSSSALTGYRNSGGTYTFKIFLANCQNFNSTSSGNPAIVGASQLIYCRSFANRGNSDWQQYLVAFSANGDYNMIVIYPEITSSSYDGGTYVHFLYPELIPINPTNQYLTYQGEKETEGMTLLSACGVTNASYEWTDSAGVVSNQQTDILGYDPSRGGNAHYTFSMWVEGAVGNNTENCTDASPPVITETSTQLPTTVRVSCIDPVTATNNCNIIPNATFTKTPGNAPNNDAFRQDKIQFWSSVNGGTPDINGAIFGSLGSVLPPIFPPDVPPTANAAGMFIATDNTSYSYEGIYAKIPQLVTGRNYAFSFFLNTVSLDADHNAADFTFNIKLSNCVVFPISPNGSGTTSPPSLLPHLDILCQNFPGVETSGWQQYFVTFTADDNYDMIVIYPQGNLIGTGINYIHFLMPELIDVTNLITVTQNSSCNYTLQSCGVTNASYHWVDGDGNSIGSSNPITVDASTNPGLYKLTLSVPHILDNPILDNHCGVNTETITALAFGNNARWTGGSTIDATDWNDADNWNPAVIPNDALTDVYIPSILTVPNQPTLKPTTINPTGTNQVHSLIIEPGGKLINIGNLQIARNISGHPGSISNYDGSDVVGSIEMNGTCAAQTLTGNVFEGNDVKNFTASNDVTISSTTGEGLDVWGELGFGTSSAALTTGNNLTLISRASSTANIATMASGNDISGDVLVERYIHTGTASASGGIPAQHAKTWQFLATPTGSVTTGQNIHDSWQEGCASTINCNSGYGAQITGTGTGFDITTAAPAMKYWDPSVGTFGDFVGITNTVSTQLYDKRGYFVFVRGDRSVNGVTSTIATPTILRSKGPVYQPSNPPPSSSVSSGYDLSVGNPYASAIDLSYMYSNSGYLTNIDDVFVVWDVSIPGTFGFGGYQYIDAGSSFTPSPGGTGNYYATGNSYSEIQSGQAFFVHASGGIGTINFNEAVKSNANRLVTRMNNAISRKSLRVGLYSSTGICDGTKVIFDNEYSNSIDGKDAKKMSNPGENFVIVKKREQAILAIEKRQLINQSDTVFYGFSNLRPISYKLRFAPESLEEKGLYATLIDNYLQKRHNISLSDTTIVDFTVDNNTNSYENRFEIVFERNKNLSETNNIAIDSKINNHTTSSIIIYPVPIENNTIKIDFVNKASGRYILQLSNNAGQIIYRGSVDINDLLSTRSIKLKSSIALGNYNLIITAPDNEITTKQVFIK